MKITWVDEPTYINSDFESSMLNLGEFEVYNDIPSENQLIERLNNTDIAIVEWSKITKKVFDSVTRCKYILLVTTSFDNVDIDAYMNQKEIVISNCTEYSSVSVSEWTISMIMALNRNLLTSYIHAKKGASHLYLPFLSYELKGRTLGLIGVGSIGKRVAELGRALGMKVIGTSQSMADVEGVELVSLNNLLELADFVSIQVPSTSARSLINEDNAKHIKAGQIIVSCSRDCLIDLDVIYELLESGRLRGVGLDDLDIERSHKIWGHDRVIVTTGIAWYSEECRQENLDVIHNMLQGYIQGEIKDKIGKIDA